MLSVYLVLGELSITMSLTTQLGWFESSTAALPTIPPTECPTIIIFVAFARSEYKNDYALPITC